MIGFKIGDKGCCGTGTLEASILCRYACSNVDDYVFWDAFHPTEKAYGILVRQSLEQYVKNITCGNSFCWWWYFIYHETQIFKSSYLNTRIKVFLLYQTCIFLRIFETLNVFEQFYVFLWDKMHIIPLCWENLHKTLGILFSST